MLREKILCRLDVEEMKSIYFFRKIFFNLVCQKARSLKEAHSRRSLINRVSLSR